jgi:hypothetical protein
MKALLLILVLLFASNAFAQCPETILLRNVRLGMSIDEVRKYQVLSDEHKITFDDAEYALTFADRKVSRIYVKYPKQWQTLSEFAAEFSKPLNLPDIWQPAGYVKNLETRRAETVKEKGAESAEAQAIANRIETEKASLLLLACPAYEIRAWFVDKTSAQIAVTYPQSKSKFKP